MVDCGLYLKAKLEKTERAIIQGDVIGQDEVVLPGIVDYLEQRLLS